MIIINSEITDIISIMYSTGHSLPSALHNSLYRYVQTRLKILPFRTAMNTTQSRRRPPPWVPRPGVSRGSKGPSTGKKGPIGSERPWWFKRRITPGAHRDIELNLDELDGEWQRKKVVRKLRGKLLPFAGGRRWGLIQDTTRRRCAVYTILAPSRNVVTYKLCSPVSEPANRGHLRSAARGTVTLQFHAPEQRDTARDVLLFLVQHSGTHSHCLFVIYHWHWLSSVRVWRLCYSAEHTKH